VHIIKRIKILAGLHLSLIDFHSKRGFDLKSSSAQFEGEGNIASLGLKQSERKGDNTL
jgi:hypothetical protein